MHMHKEAPRASDETPGRGVGRRTAHVAADAVSQPAMLRVVRCEAASSSATASPASPQHSNTSVGAHDCHGRSCVFESRNFSKFFSRSRPSALTSTDGVQHAASAAHRS